MSSTPSASSRSTRIRVAVMGAGAVGCYYGGMLARAGHEVVLIGRPQHVEAIRKHGLRMETRMFDEQVPMQASTDASAIEGADLVLFCVKSPDTEATGRDMLPWLAPHALVLTLQNGVDNAERLAAVLPDHEVASSVVYVGTEMAGPGHVKHNGRGDLVIEPTRMGDALPRLLADAAIPVEVSDNVRGALWSKLILNSAYNAASAITQLPYGRLVENVGVKEVIADVMAECLAVCAADGVTVPGDVGLSVRRIAESMPAQFSSTAQDLQRGKPSEVDYLNGYVMRRGETLGVPTPVNRVLWSLVRAIETKPVEERASAPA